jgi:hypothetical protein
MLINVVIRVLPVFQTDDTRSVEQNLQETNCPNGRLTQQFERSCCFIFRLRMNVRVVFIFRLRIISTYYFQNSFPPVNQSSCYFQN